MSQNAPLSRCLAAHPLKALSTYLIDPHTLVKGVHGIHIRSPDKLFGWICISSQVLTL